MGTMTREAFHKLVSDRAEAHDLVLSYDMAETNEEREELLIKYDMAECQTLVEREVWLKRLFSEYWWDAKDAMKVSSPTSYEEIVEMRIDFSKFLKRYDLFDDETEELLSELEAYTIGYKVRQVVTGGVKEGDLLAQEISTTAQQHLKDGQKFEDYEAYIVAGIHHEWAIGRFPSARQQQQVEQKLLQSIGSF